MEQFKEFKKFGGQKFNFEEKHTYDIYGDPITKNVVTSLTPNYKRYLWYKRLNDIKLELLSLKFSLKYEYEHYGECDDIKLKYYLSLINKYYELSGKTWKA